LIGTTKMNEKQKAQPERNRFPTSIAEDDLHLPQKYKPSSNPRVISFCLTLNQFFWSHPYDVKNTLTRFLVKII